MARGERGHSLEAIGIKPRTATRLAWGLWALATALWISALILLILNGDTPQAGVLGSPSATGLFGAAFLAFPTVGAVVASRRPENVLGWLFCAAGVVFEATNLLDQYMARALLTDPGSLPAGRYAAWAASWLFLVFLGFFLPFTLLLFPNGRLLSPRWRFAAWLVVIATVWVVAVLAVRPGPLNDYEFADNPFGVDAASEPLDVLSVLAWPLVFMSVLASVASMIQRFRRSRGEERQQLKWIAGAAAMLAAGWITAAVGVTDVGRTLGFALLFASIVGIPVATGIAILRYRLYDIDRIINRTLVYGLLTAGLGLTYFGLVVGLQALFQPLTGGSDLAIALTTLIVAALFLPARRRVQDAVDSRFNRRKYDAARTIEAFSARLREEIDLDTLTQELLAVVRETMEPAQVLLWLRTREVGR